MPTKAKTHRPNRPPRNPQAHRFYASAVWKRFRKQRRAEDPLCVDCTEGGRVKPWADLHHVESLKERPDLALDPANIVGLCKECHGRRHRAEQLGVRS